jgi:hypothetical protein
MSSPHRSRCCCQRAWARRWMTGRRSLSTTSSSCTRPSCGLCRHPACRVVPRPPPCAASIPAPRLHPHSSASFRAKPAAACGSCALAQVCDVGIRHLGGSRQQRVRAAAAPCRAHIRCRASLRGRARAHCRLARRLLTTRRPAQAIRARTSARVHAGGRLTSHHGECASVRGAHTP